jgi:hypothetical protein
VLFAADPGMESAARSRIDAALSDGQLRGPDGGVTQWRVCASHRSDIRVDERDVAVRLAQEG